VTDAVDEGVGDSTPPPFDDPDPIPPKPEVSVEDEGLAEWLREMIWMGEASRPRSRQRALGMSEVGSSCNRELAYKLNESPRVNLQSDPMASIFGTGVHVVLADTFRRLDSGVGRWLIELPVSYRGINGSLDAFDTRRSLLLDWKSTSKSNLSSVKRDGPPASYKVQLPLYAAALRTMGYSPERGALVYLPRDGQLKHLHVLSVDIDQKIADDAVDKLEALKGKGPAEVAPTPSRLCTYCPFYLPRSNDLTFGCPGR
jgi:hypothetical protein